mmetsp:Transcript_31609/g.57483  ORF Transcript_31609/g.57483 Transcript_31609/m.57483 type:complete len:435 (+) Transcript_31609:87-1391(+)
MLDSICNRFVFPAPQPSYGSQSYKRNLCWIPWNGVISPKRVSEHGDESGIPCLWFPAPKAATVILFFHANAEDLGMSFAVLRHIRDQFKVNVLAVEYPGYGLLHDMEPSEDAVYEVALTAFRFLVDEIGVRYSQIILFGRSLGSGPAVFLAAQYPVGGLILVSAFSSIKAAVQSIVGRVFAWSFTERFPNSRIIANVSCSTLFIHGESDSLIPPEHSLRLFKRCRARKLLVTPPKMEHNSNLFGDASFLAVPAIHFFGFPGYYTASPPRLSAHLFEDPQKRARLLKEKARQDTQDPLALTGAKPSWLCDCLAKGDPHHLDVNFCRQEHSVEDITIRFSDGIRPSPQGSPQVSEPTGEVAWNEAGDKDEGLASVSMEKPSAPSSHSTEVETEDYPDTKFEVSSKTSKDDYQELQQEESRPEDQDNSGEPHDYLST